jgi:hypothetical protein
MFNSFVAENIPIKTGSSCNNLQVFGSRNVSAVIGGRVLTLEGCLYIPEISQKFISLV